MIFKWKRAKKRKQQVIWFLFRTDTNALGFWLAKRTLGWENVIHHFQIDHNATCLTPSPAPPPQFCITIVFDFSWDPGEIGKNRYAKFWGQTRCIMVYVKMVNAWVFSRNQAILRFDVILQHDRLRIEQCLLHIRVFFGGKVKSPCFDLFIHWLIKQQ